MAETYGFFDSSENDIRQYSANVLAEFFKTFYTNGIAYGLKIIPGTGMTVTEQLGYAILQGFFYKNDGDLNINIDAADSNLPRIDRVVLRLDFVARTIHVIVKKGNTSSSPVTPTLQRDSNIYELSLAQINIPAGLATINSGNITDERFNSDVCGTASSMQHPLTRINDNQPNNLIQGDIWVQIL